MTTRLDQKFVDAWNEIPEATQAAIRKALSQPTQVGAVISASRPQDRNVKTSLGYVVHSSFVTPLALTLLEAVDWNGADALDKPKRQRRASEAA